MSTLPAPDPPSTESTAPAPASVDAPAKSRPPEAWAADKAVQDWALGAARARHLSDPKHPLRAAWLPNGHLTEAEFDAALAATLNGRLR